MFSGCYGDVGWHWGAHAEARSKALRLSTNILYLSNVVYNTCSKIHGRWTQIASCRRKQARYSVCVRSMMAVLTGPGGRRKNLLPCGYVSLLTISNASPGHPVRFACAQAFPVSTHCNNVVCLGHIERLPAGCYEAQFGREPIDSKDPYVGESP